MPESRPFLGVAKSATGRVWRDRLDARANAMALAIGQRHGLPELLCRVLAGRQVELDAVEGYLDPTIKGLMPDPDTLTDMAAAASRLADAAERGEQVAIIGDYDVDGATSTALLVRVLRATGLDPFFHIPDRQFEGYGPLTLRALVHYLCSHDQQHLAGLQWLLGKIESQRVTA